MLFKTLASSGIEYKPADFKAEAHFLGQIVGASNIIENDSVFIEAFFDLGKAYHQHLQFKHKPALLMNITSHALLILLIFI